MAKSNGRLAKIALPDAAMICDTISGSHGEVGAADSEQDAGDRQHRNRQHHALADFLQKREGVFERRHLHHDFVRLADQCAHFRSGFGSERFFRKLATFIEAQFAGICPW